MLHRYQDEIAKTYNDKHDPRNIWGRIVHILSSTLYIYYSLFAGRINFENGILEKNLKINCTSISLDHRERTFNKTIL